MEAAVLLAKCQHTKRTYGIRTQRMSDGDWWRTWAFPVDDSRAHKEGYDTTRVQGNLFYTEEYPGCPYCGTKGFVLCNRCKKISCWNGEHRLTCPWCKKDMNNIVSATDRFNLSGGDI